MAMVGGTISGPFDPATCSRSSPSAADWQSPAAFKRSEEVLFVTAGCAVGDRGVFFFAPGDDILSGCTDSLHSSLEPLYHTSRHWGLVDPQVPVPVSRLAGTGPLDLVAGW
jgi:hypothetical protein